MIIITFFRPYTILVYRYFEVAFLHFVYKITKYLRIKKSKI